MGPSPASFADFYARGRIRAIADAVGVDGEPLVAKYDPSRGAPQANTAGFRQWSPEGRDGTWD